MDDMQFTALVENLIKYIEERFGTIASWIFAITFFASIIFAICYFFYYIL